MFRINFLTDGPGLRAGVESFLEEWESSTNVVNAHTSGSTGVPKSIVLPKADMRMSAKATCRYFGVDSNSTLLCPLSIDYIAGKMMLVRALEAGCEVTFCKPSNGFLDSEVVREYVASRHISLLPVVPSQCNIFSEGVSTPEILKNIDNVIIGGAALNKDMEHRLLALPGDCRFFATYGMTETCSHVALRSLGHTEFSAMPGIEFSLDHRGCLKIAAPEYSFKELQTNDIADLLSSEQFIWRGRFDNVINSGGIKIFPEDVERRLDGCFPFPFYIKGVPDSKWGEMVVMIAQEDDSHLSPEEITAICRAKLPCHEIPKEIRFVRELPRTTNGKLKR